MTNKQKKSNLSTLFTQNRKIDREDDFQRVSMVFAPTITNKLKTTFTQHNMQIVYSNPFKIKNQLLSTKDRKQKLEQPGVYQIKCNKCERIYYGQTKRAVVDRFAEHKRYIYNNEPRRSAFAQHIISEEHLPVNADDVSLLKCVHDNRKLDAYESMYIHKNTDALNADKGNIESDLFKYCS